MFGVVPYWAIHLTLYPISLSLSISLFGVAAVSHLIGSLILALASVYAAREMHSVMLTNVLRWPMELFDITPTGRIINRFSKDVNVVDNILPHVIRSWIMMVFAVISKSLSYLSFLFSFYPIFFHEILRTGTRGKGKLSAF